MLNPSNEHDNPLLYPWTPPTGSGLMIDGQLISFREMRRPLGDSYLTGQTDCLNEMLHASGLPTVEDRNLMIAVGSNAAPAVMSRKLTAGTSLSLPVIPFLKATVRNLGVGHAGYVSVRGYIPATPYHAVGAETTLWASYLDDDQMEILDDTEPNYHRVKLSAEDYPLLLDNNDRPETFWVYDSYRGVLTDNSGSPIPLTTQHDLHQILSRAESVSQRFSGEPEVNILEFGSTLGRASIADILESAGLVMGTGIQYREKCRVGRSGPDNSELEELEAMLAEEDDILTKLMGDDVQPTGPVLKWYNEPDDFTM